MKRCVQAALPVFLFMSACSDSNFSGGSKTKSSVPQQPSPASDGNDGDDEPVPPDGEIPKDPVTALPEPTSCIPADTSAVPGWTFKLEDDTLVVKGNGGSNSIKATGTENSGEIEFSASSDTTLKIKCGSKLRISGDGGADEISLAGIKGLLAVELNGDEGNDNITLLPEGDAGGTPLVINGGAGDDTINVSGGGGYGSIGANGD